MKTLKIALSTMVAVVFTAGVAANAEICRSVSASWQTDNFSFRTQMWTSGKDGCKKIAHTVAQNGREDVVEGYDCDCDLKADGLEYVLDGDMHPSNAERLTALCRGPMADKPPAEPARSISDLIS